MRSKVLQYRSIGAQGHVHSKDTLLVHKYVVMFGICVQIKRILANVHKCKGRSGKVHVYAQPFELAVLIYSRRGMLTQNPFL